MRLRIVAFVLVLWALYPLPPVAAQGTIGENLICPCGCTMLLNSCECATAEEMRGVIRERLDQGQSSLQIVRYFVDLYGERVLAAPPKQGFNLTAWVLPFILLALGGGGVAVLMRRWVVEAEAPQPEYSDEYEARVERELKELDL
ncbi:MAG: cytochrome c-type biogenesis protein CcmH [Anaerolineae bacterium]